MTTLIDDILNGIDYFTCEHYAARMSKSSCIDRHARAEKDPEPRRLGGYKQNFIACLTCAQGAQIREEMDMAERGPCKKCQKVRTLLAHGMCYSCNGYGKNKKKAASGGGHKVEKKKPAHEPIQAKQDPLITKACDLSFLPGPVDPPDVELKIRNIYPSGIVPLDFTLPENAHLFVPFQTFSRSHRRELGDQAMMIIEELLTKEGLI